MVWRVRTYLVGDREQEELEDTHVGGTDHLGNDTLGDETLHAVAGVEFLEEVHGGGSRLAIRRGRHLEGAHDVDGIHQSGCKGSPLTASAKETPPCPLLFGRQAGEFFLLGLPEDKLGLRGAYGARNGVGVGVDRDPTANEAHRWRERRM